MHGRQPHAPELDPGLAAAARRAPSDRSEHAVRARREVRPGNNRRLMATVGGVAVLAALAVVVAGNDRGDGSLATAGAPTSTAPPAAPAGAEPATASAGTATGPSVQPGIAPAVAERPSVDLEGCMLDVVEIGVGDSGDSVECTQKALYANSYYDGEFTGTFDEVTKAAVERAQLERGLFVDGVVGAKTATSLGIWPGDESFVMRTPKPAPGAEDLWGMALSPVASAGDDAPPMPPDTGQGTGYRIVYSRAHQRVWAVNDAEQVVRSYLVSGSQYHNELPGRHEVYSRSEMTTAWNGAADLPLMVRWLDTERGAIGFHAIPNHRDTGQPYQTVDELGNKLSGGCQRQHLLDAQFMWAFGEVGTPVYVV